MGQVLDVALGPHRFVYSDHPELKPLKPQFDTLQLSTHEIGELYEIFLTIDSDRSGSVSVRELFAHLATEATYFRDRVFTLFDDDGSGKVDFREFVLSLWNYCTLSKASLVLFAFDLYDRDSTGELSPAEIEQMLIDLYGKQAHSHPQSKQIAKYLKALDRKATINVDRFRAFVTTHPALLFPAFQMQLGLRQNVLGVHFWERCAEKRIKLVDGRRVALGKLLEMNVHQDAYLSVLKEHEELVAQEKQASLEAYHQSKISNKHNAVIKSKSRSMVDWVGISHQLSTIYSGKSTSKKYTESSRKNNKKIHPQNQSTESGNDSTLLHPRDELALLILQVTGTHHYRRIWTQHHLTSASTTNTTSTSQTNNSNHSTDENIPSERGQSANNSRRLSSGSNDLPHFVAPPLLSLSTPADNLMPNGDKSAIAGPPNADLYQMLLQGDAIQRQHKFVELGTAKKHLKTNHEIHSEEQKTLTQSPSDSSSPQPVVDQIETPTDTPTKHSVQKNATPLLDLSTASPLPASNNRKELLKWQANVVEQSGILHHAAQHQQHSVAASPATTRNSSRRGSATNEHASPSPSSLKPGASPDSRPASGSISHRKNDVHHCGVRLIGEAVGETIVAPRLSMHQQQLQQFQAQLLAQQQQAALAEYLGPTGATGETAGGSRNTSRRNSYQK